MSPGIPAPRGTSAWRFGEEPLPGAREFASAVRSLVEAALSLEEPSPLLERLVAEIRRTDAELRAGARVTPAVRIGERADDLTLRPYLDHSVDIGAFNPMFPEYGFRELEPGRATGSVCFPIAYEGPPGFVHGGFLAVFFDSIVTHHSCESGVAGKTKSLEVRYARPVPLGVDLDYTIERSVAEREIVSTAALFDGSRLLCEAEIKSVAGRRENLPRAGERAG